MFPVALLLLAPLVSSLSVPRASCTISSLDDVDDVLASCTDITIASFTVDGNTAFDLSALAQGSTVTLAGNVTFAKSTDFSGPMFIIDGSDITFDGAGFTFDGNGPAYWDGLGGNGGVTKPQFLKIKISGTFKDLVVLNAPRNIFSVGSNDAALTISGVTIDNTAGNVLNSNGIKLGHNTDCFDVSAHDVTITGCTCLNQDDCLAVNSGSNILFSDNFCSGGHGISIGSIATGKTVTGVTISGNTVVKSTNGLRIKTVFEATNGSVSDITYTDNDVEASDFGVIIEQDYENGSPTGVPTNGIEISNVIYSGKNSVRMTEDDGLQVFVLCGDGSCTGTWDWKGLAVSGGESGSITGDPPIVGFSLD
ncbi:glycoside hydrolase [Hymenopellis radicata]|nr:glycoside hydrolase [Hymenopellis radicata]